MARIILTSHGTTGDIFPFLALGKELQRAGHVPRLVVDRSYASVVAAHGLECALVDTGRDERKALEATMRDVIPRANVLTQLVRSIESIYVATAAPFRDVLLEEALRADLLVANAATFAGGIVHEKTGIPLVSVFLGHVLRSAYYPPPAPPPFRTRYPSGRLGRLLNAAIWSLADATGGRMLMRGINRTRLAEGLKPIPRFDQLAPESGSCLVAVSRILADEKPDWPQNRHVTGFLFDHEHLKFQPEPELTRFLSEGEPPIVFAFGSMAGVDPARWTRLLLDGLEAAGRPRAIIQSGWGELGNGVLPAHVRRVGFAPHDWLFSRASCVVHHGGAGTSGAALSAGVPSVVVCCWNDQMLWASELRRIGVAGVALTLRSLTPKRLAAGLKATLGSDAMRAQARTLGAVVRKENGVFEARRWIEAALESRPPAA